MCLYVANYYFSDLFHFTYLSVLLCRVCSVVRRLRPLRCHCAAMASQRFDDCCCEGFDTLHYECFYEAQMFRLMAAYWFVICRAFHAVLSFLFFLRSDFDYLALFNLIRASRSLYSKLLNRDCASRNFDKSPEDLLKSQHRCQCCTSLLA